MRRRRARLPHSDRLIWPTVIFTSHVAAANAPIATSAIAAACRREGLILSAIKIPKPRPMAVRVTTRSGSSGSCSEVFEMDMGKDIAYHIRRAWEKETAILPPGGVEKPRCATLEVIQRDVSTSLDMTEN